MVKKDYTNWSKESLVKEVEKLEKRKKYGLVWDDEREPEKVVEHLAQKEKIDKFWCGLSSAAEEIRVIALENQQGKRYYQIVSNNEIQRSIIDKLGLSHQLPVITTSLK
jgi:hypothetical protein